MSAALAPSPDKSKDELGAPPELAHFGAFFRARDAVNAGVSFYRLDRAVRAGGLEKIAPGLYRRAVIAPTEAETLAMVCAAVPTGTICLLSALRVHDIGTQSPHEVWLTLDRRARKPGRPPSAVQFIRASGVLRTYGVVPLELLGVHTSITDPARTVVDCFRYRNKIGLDIAIDALRDVLRSRKASADEITHTADACRARTIMQPYLEAMLA